MNWPNFTREEFACQCGCGGNEVQDDLIDRLQRIRTRLKMPLRVTSGYRCPDHPIEAAKSKPGAHTTGLAADIGIDRGEAFLFLSAALDENFTGIGVNQKGEGRFIHVDLIPNRVNSPRPTIWSY